MKRVNPCTSSVTKGDTIMLMTPELLRGETCVFIHLLNYLEQHNGTYPKWCNGTNPNKVLACFQNAQFPNNLLTLHQVEPFELYDKLKEFRELDHLEEKANAYELLPCYHWLIEKCNDYIQEVDEYYDNLATSYEQQQAYQQFCEHGPYDDSVWQQGVC